jgi:outer membrane protein assembly factor BamA
VLVATGCLCCGGAWSQSTDPAQGQPQGMLRWLDPSTAPFVPVPVIDVDPNSGTTLGLMPVWLKTGEQGEVRQIIAPDIEHNPNFGVGAVGRIYDFPSEDSQWSLLAGAKQRVEKQFDYEYDTGRRRDGLFSFTASVVYDRSGTPRFYGLGNDTHRSQQSSYTLQQKYVQGVVGLNVSQRWQISYAFRARALAVQPDALTGIASTPARYAHLDGLGVSHESFNRLALVYDSRDDLVAPSQGGKYVAYAAAASRNGLAGTSAYAIAGIDLRQLWKIRDGVILAGHTALRYTLGGSPVPFWSLASLGGDDSNLGQAQPLRGYGTGRFNDRDSFSATLEWRWRVLSSDRFASHINVELTPFVDAGRVFAGSGTFPVSNLHKVAGIGFRGIASPFVVGFVDLGYGSEGVAAFTGINYPF